MITFLKNIFKHLLFIIIIFFIFSNNILFAKFIRDTEIEDILYKWTNPIIEVAGISENNLKIHIIADKSINAFVTNGQNMFLNTGLITQAGSASGLIGVIAHEIGHIKAGHIVKMKQAAKKLESNQFITSLLGMGLIMAGASNDTFKDDKMIIAQTALSIGPSIATKSFFSFSRGNEYVADTLAIEFLKKVKRDPMSLSIILNKLYGQELLLLERQDPFLRTHPLSKARMDLIKQKTSHNDVFLESEFDKVSYARLKAKLEGFLEAPGKTLLKNTDNSLHNRYARTIAYFRVPMYRKAILEINSLLKDYPNDPYFIELKAQILAENGKVKPAIKFYRKALSILPQSTLITLSLSGLLLEDNNNTKQTKEAKNYLNFVIEKEPNNIMAWHLKGICHNRLGEPIKANLSAAEAFLRKRDSKNAKFFAKKVIADSNKYSSENLRASDILNLINQI
ncbi:MAG: hypothetical protein CMP36_00415 [Rickettsiales bacterium]|nr:hypothetical protein [Rickettsiales bacterium]OUV83273.1 MAG: hypothetical protein CBC91_00795 [Rickettsiales bacterium TMED131]